jgi:hypothetical protein
LDKLIVFLFNMLIQKKIGGQTHSVLLRRYGEHLAVRHQPCGSATTLSDIWNTESLNKQTIALKTSRVKMRDVRCPTKRPQCFFNAVKFAVLSLRFRARAPSGYPEAQPWVGEEKWPDDLEQTATVALWHATHQEFPQVGLVHAGQLFVLDAR